MKNLKIKSKILCIAISLFIFGNLGGQTTTPKVCISKFTHDSLRVSVNDIVNNPTIKVCSPQGAFEIISYQLSLNINGVIYNWGKLTEKTLSQERIEKLQTVRNDMPEYNKLIIDQVKYIKPDGSISTAEGLYLWLAKDTDCNGKFDIEDSTYKSGEIFLKYFYCNDSAIKVISYRKNGAVRGTIEYHYTPDTIAHTIMYREDGSKIIYQREVNGKDDGDYFIYYPDGSIKLEAESIKGIRIHEKIYDKNKRLKEETKYDNSGVGTWTSYDKNGNIKKKKLVKNAGIKYKCEF